MEEEKIIEGNNLIDEFMGFYPSKVSYEYDWNYLMEIIEKIEKTQIPHHGYFACHIVSNSCTIHIDIRLVFI